MQQLNFSPGFTFGGLGFFLFVLVCGFLGLCVGFLFGFGFVLLGFFLQ